MPVLGHGIVLSLLLMLIARPATVFAALLGTKLNLKEQALLAWGSLRGAVPIILGTFPLIAGLPQANMTFHLVFFIVLTSVLLQGTTLPLAARWLGLSRPPIRAVQSTSDA